jgi:hypothetical protein
MLLSAGGRALIGAGIGSMFGPLGAMAGMSIGASAAVAGIGAFVAAIAAPAGLIVAIVTACAGIAQLIDYLNKLADDPLGKLLGPDSWLGKLLAKIGAGNIAPGSEGVVPNMLPDLGSGKTGGIGSDYAADQAKDSGQSWANTFLDAVKSIIGGVSIPGPAVIQPAITTAPVVDSVPATVPDLGPVPVVPGVGPAPATIPDVLPEIAQGNSDAQAKTSGESWANSFVEAAKRIIGGTVIPGPAINNVTGLGPVPAVPGSVPTVPAPVAAVPGIGPVRTTIPDVLPDLPFDTAKGNIDIQANTSGESWANSFLNTAKRIIGGAVIPGPNVMPPNGPGINTVPGVGTVPATVPDLLPDIVKQKTDDQAKNSGESWGNTFLEAVRRVIGGAVIPGPNIIPPSVPGVSTAPGVGPVPQSYTPAPALAPERRASLGNTVHVASVAITVHGGPNANSRQIADDVHRKFADAVSRHLSDGAFT